MVKEHIPPSATALLDRTPELTVIFSPEEQVRPPERRTGRRRRLVLAATVLVLGPVAAGSAAAAEHARSLDAAASADVRLTASLSGRDPLGAPVVTLRSQGQHPVVVREVVAQAPEYDALAVGTTLSGEGTLAVPLLPSRCEHLAPSAEVPLLQVVVTTWRQQEVRRALWLGPEVSQALTADLRARCGFPAEVALEWHVTRSRLTGTGLEVTYALSDRSLLPVTIGYLRPLSGLRLVGPPLPMVLRPGTHGDPGPAADVTLLFARNDCSALTRAARAGVPWGVLAIIDVDGRIGRLPLLLVDPHTGLGGPNPLPRLARGCYPG